MKYPYHLLKLIDMLKKLPGVGNKSAERFAFHMLTWPPHHLQHMAKVIDEVPAQLKQCVECGCLMDEEGCAFCVEERTQQGCICIIASQRDAFFMEDTGQYKGLYHTLGTLLSPMDGIGPDKLRLEELIKRITQHSLKEVIIALDSTIEGDTTALYLKQELAHLPVRISRLAFGLPMGSSLDYVDGGTLARAFSGRALF
jgi:recombination protein RecR